MSDAKDQEVFGALNPSDFGAERPLVTFALFAYNQEAYIREAVEGAFAQTYSPLEIILSDDCSKDRTFEIMQEMAAAYKGPHRVRVRRSEPNLGLIKHIDAVVQSATGQIIVMAAGDDVSLPSRVRVLVDRLMQEDQVMLVHSTAIAMDHAGAIIGPFDPPNKESHVDPIRVAAAASIYIGATGAFRTSFYHQFGPIMQRDTYEDLVFGFRAALVSGMRYVDQPLIRYRVGVGLSNQHLDKRVTRKHRRLNAIKRMLGTFRQRRMDLEQVDHIDTSAIARVLDDQINKTLARLQLYTEKKEFFKYLLSARPYWYWRAMYSEARFTLHMID